MNQIKKIFSPRKVNVTIITRNNRAIDCEIISSEKSPEINMFRFISSVLKKENKNSNVEENNIQNISVRSDLIGDYSPKDNLLGYKAEMFLKRILRSKEEELTQYLVDRYNLARFSYYLQPRFMKKYKRYLIDTDAKQYILEKYGEKQSLMDIVVFRVTDLPAKECLRLKEDFEETNNYKKLAAEVVGNYLTELRLILPVYDTKKKENL